jgi:hypothetical protein
MTRRKDLVFGISMAALSIALAIQSFRYPADSAFFPRILSLLLLALSLVILIRALRRPKGEAGGGPAGVSAFMKSPPVLVFGATVLYVVLIPFLGFLVSTALFLFGSILFLNRRRPVLAILCGIGYAAALYALFHTVLKVTLPAGWLM